jgi:ubiquitin carboxyl-terminal hydrolase L3
MAGNKTWFPLESNPDVMNKYVGNLGLDTSKICYHDVMSTDDWALDMVPKPVSAVLLLYQIKDSTEKHRDEEMVRIEKDGQNVSDKVYYMSQTVGNACGTIAILHSIENARRMTPDQVSLAPDSFLSTFYQTNGGKEMSAADIGRSLEANSEIDSAHTTAAEEGQTNAAEHENTRAHFVCLSYCDGAIYELDGRSFFPSPLTLCFHSLPSN